MIILIIIIFCFFPKHRFRLIEGQQYHCWSEKSSIHIPNIYGTVASSSTCNYFENQLWRGVSSQDTLLNKTCFYLGLLHTYAAVEHANAFLEHACAVLEHTYAVLEYSSGFQPDKVFSFISEAFSTHFLSLLKHFILILSKKLGFWQKNASLGVISQWYVHNIFCFHKNSVLNHSHSKHLVYVHIVGFSYYSWDYCIHE